MKLVVSSQGSDLDAPASPVFGRCPTYLFVDSETLEFEAVPNPAMNQGGGAGIQAAQFVVGQGAQAVLSGNLGPNAFDVLQAAGVPGYLVPEGTVRQVVEAFRAGQLQPMGGSNVAAHAGMGGGMTMGAGRGRGMGTGGGGGRGMGMGSGRGRGMGGGGGRGMGMGAGRGLGTGGGGRGMGMQPASPVQPAAQAASASEMTELRGMLKSLQQQLADAMAQIEELEKEN